MLPPVFAGTRAVMRPVTLAALLSLLLLLAGPAAADKFRNPIALFNGLDKITGRIIAFEVQIDETVQFGALQLTPKVCYTRPATEQPMTTGFVEVDEITLNNEQRRIFNGWMFAASPGINAVEHATYDVWLTGCKGATERDFVRGPPIIEEVLEPVRTENQLARPLGVDGRPVLTDEERAAQARRLRRPQAVGGPILPGEPLATTAPAQPAPRPQPRGWFPFGGGGGGGGILIDPANR